MNELNSRIFVHDKPEDNTLLRHKAKPFQFTELSPKEIRELIAHMRRVMHRAKGVGLSANQIGLPYSLFVAEVPTSDGDTKFYAIFNPQLENLEEKVVMEEGCLSVPGIYGEIERYERVTLKGQDKGGKVVKIKAWGLLAQVFQHEIGHLHGELYIDKAKNTYSAPSSERPQEREKELHTH